MKRAFIDCTQNHGTTTRARLAILKDMANQFYEEDNLVGFDKAHSLICHLQSELDFLSFDFHQILDDDFTEGGRHALRA